MPYHPMKGYMEKLDDWGAQQSKRLTSGRDAGPGASMGDRLNLARGKDDRWNKFQERRGAASSDAPPPAVPPPPGEDPNNIVPTRSGRAVPPPRPSTLGAGAGRPGAPPPPPARAPSQSSATGVASSPPARRPAPPVLPRRMDNEAGIDKPPPPYIPSAKPPAPPVRQPSQQSVSAGSGGLGAIEFSKFTQEQKEEFFALLDEFFASRQHGKGKATRAAPAPSPAPSQRRAAPPVAAAKKPAETVQHHVAPPRANGRPSATPSSSSSWSYPRLGTSRDGADDVCTALHCASFFVYRDHYPEWNGASPWYTQQNATPSTIRSRNDLTWSMGKQYMNTSHTLMGCATFADLSILWWKVTWDSSRPASSMRAQVAYKDRAEAWNDEERLLEAHRQFGEWIAGFAEQAERNRTPIGDGECWTLAAEAIKYTNATAQLTEANRLLQTIGRTHGHLIYAGKADPSRGQCGRWRGGDCIRDNWGGIRRGDIVEWRTVKIRERSMPRGAYATLGAPDHTAVVVDNSPVPERLSQPKSKSAKGGDDYYTLLGIKPTASQADVRSAYLLAARRHHPDRANGAGDDAYMQQLNTANATLSDPSRRKRYDEERASGRSGGGTHAQRVSQTIDLDAMEVVEGAGSDSLAFSYPCRCGGSFQVGEQELQNVASLVTGCSGCSERIRVVADVSAQEENTDDADNDDEGQPELAPWELGTITTIEQSAGQVPTRRTYDLGKDSFTEGEMWVFRPVWESQILGGTAKPSWPPTLPGWQEL